MTPSRISLKLMNFVRKYILENDKKRHILIMSTNTHNSFLRLLKEKWLMPKRQSKIIKSAYTALPILWPVLAEACWQKFFILHTFEMKIELYRL